MNGKVIFLCLFISGCTPLSLLPDVISYSTTNKGISDNIISEVRKEDCALLNIVKKDSFCIDNKKEN